MRSRLFGLKTHHSSWDTQERIAERIRFRQAAERGVADREARFPLLTFANAREAIAYQEERIRFHLEHDGKLFEED